MFEGQETEQNPETAFVRVGHGRLPAGNPADPVLSAAYTMSDNGGTYVREEH